MCARGREKKKNEKAEAIRESEATETRVLYQDPLLPQKIPAAECVFSLPRRRLAPQIQTLEREGTRARRGETTEKPKQTNKRREGVCGGAEAISSGLVSQRAAASKSGQVYAAHQRELLGCDKYERLLLSTMPPTDIYSDRAKLVRYDWWVSFYFDFDFFFAFSFDSALLQKYWFYH